MIACFNPLFPSVQTECALAAANGLLQAVEVSLPKQKKSQAVSEFKCSVILHTRRAKVQEEPGMSSQMCKCVDVFLLSKYAVLVPHNG